MTDNVSTGDQDPRADQDEPSPPWWGVDSETGEGYFGPMAQADAEVAREAHARREFIELVRQAPVWEGTA